MEGLQIQHNRKYRYIIPLGKDSSGKNSYLQAYLEKNLWFEFKRFCQEYRISYSDAFRSLLICQILNNHMNKMGGLWRNKNAKNRKL